MDTSYQQPINLSQNALTEDEIDLMIKLDPVMFHCPNASIGWIPELLLINLQANYDTDT